MESFPPYPIGPGQRALAAIVFTDVVSFSARMQANEETTLALLQRDFAAMKKLCLQHSGSVLKSTGDGLLLYFSSAVQAVACALRMQKYFAKKAQTLPANEVLVHRVGIHLGDVFIHDQDVMGDGVNIAARLQAEAEPGGICISQTVYDVVKNKLELQVTKLGPRELKNITEAIPVYRILLEAQGIKTETAAAPEETPAAAAAPIAPPTRGLTKTLALFIVVGLLLAAGLAVLATMAWRSHQRQRVDQARGAASQSNLNSLLQAGANSADNYNRAEMARALNAWRDELNYNRSRAAEEYNFAELADSLRDARDGTPAKTDAALRRLALARLQGLFGWMGTALQHYTKENPLGVRELSGTAPMELKVFGGVDRGLYSAEGGAVRQRNWADLKPAMFGAMVVGVLLDGSTPPSREVVQGAEIFALFYGLPEMTDALHLGPPRAGAK